MAITQDSATSTACQLPQLSDVVTDLVNYAAVHGPRRHWANLVGLQRQLASRAFNLVVFGEFKRGKSTLINALIGQAILPAAVVPLTSIITVVRHGDRVRCRVTYLDGREEETPVKRLSEFVSETGNPENEKQVALVDLHVPSELLASGLCLVDTPGVGSIHLHNTEVTQRFLNQVDGAVLVLAADPPISQSELQFAQEIMQRTSRIFVVLNKVDQLGPTDREEALDFTQGVLAKTVPEELLELLPISARLGLQARQEGDSKGWEASGVDRLSARLQRFAQEDLLNTLHKSIARRTGAVAEELQLAASLQRRSLDLTVAQLKDSVGRFRKRRDAILNAVNDSKVLVRTAVDRVVRTSLQEDYQAARQEGLRKLKAAYTSWADEPRDVNFRELLEQVNEYVERALRESISAWKDEEEQGRLMEGLSEALERFGTRVSQRLRDIYAAARKEFELPEPKLGLTVALPTTSRFSWREREWKVSTSTGLNWAWAFMGEERKKAALLREGERVLIDQFEKACGRLRHDFERRLRQASEDYMDNILAALNQALADVDHVLDELLHRREEAASRRVEERDKLDRRVVHMSEQIDALAEILTDGSPQRRQREQLMAAYVAAKKCVREIEGVIIQGASPTGEGPPLTALGEDQQRPLLYNTGEFMDRLREHLAQSAPRELAHTEQPQPVANTLVWAANLIDRLRQIADEVSPARMQDYQLEEDEMEGLKALHEDLVGFCEAARRKLPRDAAEAGD